MRVCVFYIYIYELIYTHLMFGHVDYESHLLGRFLSCSPETPMKSGEIFAPLWDSEARRQGRGELMKKGLPCGHLVFLWTVGK